MKRLIITTIILLVFAFQAFAQGNCTKERKLPHASGIVLLTNGVPVTQTTVELHENDYDGRIIATTETDNGGHFSFAGIKVGRYVIKVTSNVLPSVYIKIRVTSKALPKNQRIELAIFMYGDIKDFCGGGYSELRKCKIE
jgi:Carboxypeptidase regulatory-like domain